MNEWEEMRQQIKIDLAKLYATAERWRINRQTTHRRFFERRGITSSLAPKPFKNCVDI